MSPRNAKLWLVAVVVLTATSMAPSLVGGWLGDDHFLVTEATCNHGIEQIPAIVGQEAGRCSYRPLRHISYAVDHSVWGLNPLGYRLTNLLLHLLALAGVFLLCRRLGLSPPFAAVGAAVFGLHPVQADAVAYVSGRRDVLMGLGYVVSVVGALQFGRSRASNDSALRQLGWAAMSVLGALASVTSKEMGVTVVAIIALLFLGGGAEGVGGDQPPSEPLWKRIIQHKWLLLALTIPSGLMILWRGIIRPVSTLAHSLFGGSLETHVATVLSVHARYAELLVFPWRLAGDYAPPVIEVSPGMLHPVSLLGGGWIALLAVLGLYWYRRGWLRESLGIAWYLVAMLPVSHIIPHHEIAAEHYLYIPIVGLALCAASLSQRIWAKLDVHGHRFLGAALIAALGLLGARTFVRAFDYRGQQAHAQATLRHFPTSVRGRARLGLSLLQSDGFDAAKPHLDFVLGTTFQGSARADVLRVLGQYFVGEGEHAKGAKLLAEYTRLHPEKVAPLEALSKALFELGRIGEARDINKRLVGLEPTNAEYRYKFALTCWLIGQRQTASEQVGLALDHAPEHLDALLLGATIAVETDPKTARVRLHRAKALIDQRAHQPPARQLRLLRNLSRKLDSGGDEFDP